MTAIPGGGNAELTLDVDDTTRAAYCALANAGPLRERFDLVPVVR